MKNYPDQSAPEGRQIYWDKEDLEIEQKEPEQKASKMWKEQQTEENQMWTRKELEQIVSEKGQEDIGKDSP